MSPTVLFAQEHHGYIASQPCYGRRAMWRRLTTMLVLSPTVNEARGECTA